ncbi:MAG: uroporphyrinogen-III C-methyltransferase [Candidatus Omnitrophica bacterium]|nr:uroporphyrinogen-III C-methyltransferase [Candidatus Omnitrophota bacterium]MCM8800318.1 uroporphyrinogen-III C-methyltransferase [Candidatus Omnitrophota bacterium]
MEGKVYLIGAGPGKTDLITLRGLNILKEADVVIYDYLVDRKILDEAKEDAELICCDKLGRDRYSDGFLIHQEKINEIIVKKAKEGKKVVRLKNGDPSIFSRLSQELDILVKNKIEFEIVPGVTAASGAGCFSGIPLTDRRFASSCVLVTGHEDLRKLESSIDWESLSKIGTIVFYMGLENLPGIIGRLVASGKSPYTPVAVIQEASLITQKMVRGTLRDIVKKVKEKDLKPPVVIIIGEVVKLEKDFNWLRKSKRILFTGISGERFFTKGIYFHLPLIKIEPLDDYTDLDKMIKQIEEFDWIVFSSRYGVEYFFKRFHKLGYDARRLNRIKIGVIGNSTKNRLLEFGIIADLVPKVESSKGLLEEFKKIDLKDKKIFLPQSDISDKGLKVGLKLQGAKVTSCVAYRNVMPKDLPDLDLDFFDEIMFTSPSTVRNFVKRYNKIPKKLKVNYIGEVTRKELKKQGLICD